MTPHSILKSQLNLPVWQGAAVDGLGSVVSNRSMLRKPLCMGARSVLAGKRLVVLIRCNPSARTRQNDRGGEMLSNGLTQHDPNLSTWSLQMGTTPCHWARKAPLVHITIKCLLPCWQESGLGPFDSDWLAEAATWRT